MWTLTGPRGPLLWRVLVQVMVAVSLTGSELGVQT